VAFFIGTFENKVDRKGRVSVPSQFRQALSGSKFQGIVVFPSPRGGLLEACGADHIEQLVNQGPSSDLLGDAPLAPVHDIFYQLQQLSFDGDGRVILPIAFRDLAGINDQAIFVGIGPYIQIWSPDRLAAYHAQRKGSTP
jgi:MraZ protein